MTRKTSPKGAMGIRLEDMLTQKQVLPAMGTDTLLHIRNLESEVDSLKSANARLEADNRDLKARVEDCSQALLPDPDTCFSRGVAALKAEDALEAIVLLRMVLAMRPDHVKARLNLAVGYHLLGDIPLAIDALRQVLNQDPENILARENLAILTESHQTGSP